MGVAFLASMGFTSCKKDYTCTCTTTIDLFGEKTTTKTSTTINDTKKKAKDACEGASVKSEYGNITCEIE